MNTHTMTGAVRRYFADKPLFARAFHAREAENEVPKAKPLVARMLGRVPSGVLGFAMKNKFRLPLWMGMGAGAALLYYLLSPKKRLQRSLRKSPALTARDELSQEAELSAEDRLIEARVRSELGKVLTHSAPLQVEVQDGCVCLRGPVLAQKLEAALRCARSVEGVIEVENELAPFTESQSEDLATRHY